MLLFALRNLRARAGRTLFTALAIALGVALVFATRIISVAADEQARAARENKLAGADLEVAPTLAQYFPIALTQTILRDEAVERVAPLYRYAAAEGALDLLGVDPARTLSPYELIAGDFLSGAADEILLPETWAAQNGLGVGQTVRLEVEGQTVEWRVIGLLKSNPFSAATAWVSLATLQAQLNRPDAVNAILVRLKAGASSSAAKARLAESLGSAYVVTSVQDTALGLQGPGAITNIAFPFASAVVLLSGAYLIYNAFALTLAERKREIGQLRALGMTRGQVMAQTLLEALLISGAGSLAGLLLGLALSYALAGAALGIEYSVSNIIVPLDGALMALAIGVGLTLFATLALAWQAGRVSPLVALQDSVGASHSRLADFYERRGWVGALGLLILFGLTNNAIAAYLGRGDVVGPPLLYTLIPLLIPPFIMLLAIPAVMRGVLRLMERAFPAVVVARLAVGNIRKQRSRALLTAGMFAVSLMLVIALYGVIVGFTSYFATSSVSFFTADFSLLRPGALSFANLAPATALEADLNALRAEAEVFDIATTRLPGYDVGADNDVWVVSLDYLRAHPNLAIPVEGTLEEGERYSAAGPTLFLTESAARRHNLHVGDQTPVGTLEGPVMFTVGLIHIGFTVIPEQYGPRYFGAHPLAYLVNASPGQDKAALRARLTGLAQKHDLQLIDDPEQWAFDTFDSLLSGIFGLFTGLMSISGIVASLNLINLLVASVLERQRELGTLRALGLQQAQLRWLVVVEAGLLGLVGTALGMAGALAISWASVHLLAKSVESALGPMTEAPALPWLAAGLTLLLGPAIAMLTALWPADRAASVNPAEAMRAEGATGFLKPAPHLGPTGLRGLVARLPLSAQLSFSLGVIFIATLTLTTYFRVEYERRLLADNMRSILQRGFDLLNLSTREALPTEATELTPALLRQLADQTDRRLESLNAAQTSDSPYEFGLKYFFITDNRHTVLLSDRAEFNAQTLTDTVTVNGSATLVRETSWLGVHAFEVVMPIENAAGQRLGFARVGLSAEPVDNVIGDIQRSSILTALIALVMAIALTVFFTRRALAPVAEVVTASHAVARGDLTRRVPETRWDDVGQLARAFNEMVAGLTDRERMRDLFGRYLSREVSEAVLAGRVSLTGERKTITCLYVDMRGSTSFAEKHAPEDVMAALNDYFEVIILATEAHGGIVNRFVGDEAVCVFGAPREYRDHADRALQAALAMRTGLAYLNRKREVLGLPTLKFGMGLNSGEVVAGATGSEERQEYTVIGDAMNVGARIQGLTKNFPEHDIILSEYTRAALKNEYALVDLGPAELRGKSDLVRVFGAG